MEAGLFLTLDNLFSLFIYLFFFFLPTAEIIALLTGQIGANLPAAERG